MDAVPPAASSPAPAQSSRARRRHTAIETRDRRRRVLMVGLSVVLGILLVNATVGENGYLATVQVSREADGLWDQVARTRLENLQLQEQGHRLATDPLAVEEAARRDLGMLRPGETLIVIRDAASSAPPPAAR